MTLIKIRVCWIWPFFFLKILYCCQWKERMCVIFSCMHCRYNLSHLELKEYFYHYEKINSFHPWLQQHAPMYFIDWFTTMHHRLVMLKFIMSKKLFIHFVVFVTDNILKWAMIICMVCFLDHIYFAQTLGILNGDTNEK